MPIAVYAGSFDPVTVGHVDIVQRASRLFDEIIVGVGIHPSKRYWFEASERVRMVQEATSHLTNVRVHSFEGLLVDLCRAEQAEVIVRGVRDSADATYEMRYAVANRDLAAVETVFFTADPSTSFVSSTIVKEISGNGGDVSRYVPEGVLRALQARAV